MCVFGPLTHRTLMRQILKLLNNIRNILKSNISNAKLCLLKFLWPSNGLETQRGNQPLDWYSKIIFWFWRYYFHLVKTTKFQRDVQGDVLLTIIDLPLFPKIVMSTSFHVHRCEKFLPERLLSGATMINRQWCYNF